MSRFIDFDAARAERKREPVVVRFFGRDWDLHTGMPARVMLDVVEAQAGGGEDISSEDAVRLLRELVPTGVFDQWCDLGLTIDELGDLVQPLMRAYSGVGDDAGEAEAPKAAAKRSSARSGGSSKRTGSASTAATSTPRSKQA